MQGEGDFGAQKRPKRVNFITKADIKEAFKTFGPDKAAGLDGVKPRVLSQLDDNTLEMLVIIYEWSLALGYVPFCWRQTKVIFIPKPGKDDYSTPKSFTPISLSSFLWKGLERVVLWEVERTYLSKNPINKQQYAFCKGSSCEAALSNMVNEIERSITRKQYALGIFLDISGAFDNLDPRAATRGMAAKGISKTITKWYGHYLHNRYVYTSLNGATASRQLTRGTPQGGVLSPVVWNLAFDELLDLFSTGPVKIIGFADDAALVILGQDLSTMRDLAQIAINKAVKWGNKNGLTFGAAKTVAVVFASTKIPKLPKPLMVDGQEVQYSEEVKYLGVTLDSKLSFQSHISLKIKKAKNLIFNIKKAIGQLWGPSPAMMRWMYTGIIRPTLTYGAIIWANKCPRHTKALDRLQRLAMLNATHILRSAPTRGLEVIMGIPPLHLYLSKMAECAYMRNRGRFSIGWDGIGDAGLGHLKTWAKNTVGILGEGSCKAILNEKMLKSWTELWETEDRFRQTKLWFPKLDLTASKSLLTHDRVTYGHLVQLITGHNYLNYHQNNMSRINSPLCRFCDDEDETSWHITADCPRYHQIRMCITGHYNIPLSLRQLPAFLRESNIGELLAPKG